ncbi:hypothetical protein AJ87_05730 [Rhizobium yanglingense]|nr:hypothetical protein AJ87_05730 [Rhizobium yanglingense]
MGFDADSRNLQRAEHFGRHCFHRGIDFRLGHAHRHIGKIDAVEFLAIFGERFITAGAHVVDIVRTAAFTSSETSRLVVKNAAKRCSKPSDV